MMGSQNAWGNSANKPMEPVSFAEIMSEEYAYRVHNQEQKRFKEHLSKQAKSESTDAALASALNNQIGDTKLYSAVVDGPSSSSGNDNILAKDGEWEDYSSLLSAPDVEASASSNQISDTKLYSTVVDGPSSSSGNDNIQAKDGEWEDYSSLLSAPDEEDTVECDSDAIIAQMLQSQFDHEYNEELRRIENKRNKDCKVTVTLDKYRRNGDLEFIYDSDNSLNPDEEDNQHKRDWDRFETNEKLLDTIPKCGFKMDKEGEMITKHDPQLCGVRNACRVMSFPPDFPTGDGAGFDMKLSNKVFNQLKTYSQRGTKKNKMHDRKANVATAEMGLDKPTRLLLYKLLSNQILGDINGIISTGKEAVIIHAISNPDFAKDENNYNKVICSPHSLPGECAIKIFKTTLNEFKQRDRYIKDDYRFKDRFSKQNNRVIINMWAEKEMHNLVRMQSVGINCPVVVALKKHILVMSFIGQDNIAAPKLKNARLSESELSLAYEEIVTSMYKLYNEAKLVHADLSEYNILWYDGKCWFIDVAQSVEPEHPSALEFLMRDCGNIITFFEKRGLPNIYTKEELFEHITSLNAETHNVAMLERIHTRGASIADATAPCQEECPEELKPLTYPFDLAWEKVQSERKKQKLKESKTNSSAPIIDRAASAMSDLKVSTPTAETENKF